MRMQTFVNPVIPGLSSDPSVCRAGGDYFLVTSSFEYTPGIPLYHSTDLVNWTLLKNILVRKSQLPLNLNGQPHGGFLGIYAVTIRHHNGTFYIITTNESPAHPPNTGRMGLFVMTTTDIFNGEWSDPLWVAGVQGIDPSLFFEDDGKVYLTITRYPNVPAVEHTFEDDTWGIQMAEIDLTTGALGPMIFLSAGSGGKHPEGPHIYKINGYYYLIIAEGGTEYCHMVCALRATSIYGPYESCPHNPILSNRSLQSPIQGIGHADIIQSVAGDWYLFCHGLRTPSYPNGHILGRETVMTPIEFNADGWPVVRGGHPTITGRLFTSIPVALEFSDQPAAHASGKLPEYFVDEHTGEFMPHWNQLAWGVSIGDNCTVHGGRSISIAGNPTGLSDGPPVAFLGRRQQHLTAAVYVSVSVSPQPGDEAGLVVYQNSKHHYEIFLTNSGDETKVCVRHNVGKLSAVVATSSLIDPTSLRIWIRADLDNKCYRFGYVADGTNIELAGSDGPFHYLSTEVAGGFVGVFYGIFVKSVSGTEARFDDFEYEW
ncbi:hypothetical protein HDU84_004133 [Entophlyctis sp. JEL0112]|nr:hypothetical protein HDU84_004133 [Entophlyctis sp. JEL0112]